MKQQQKTWLGAGLLLLLLVGMGFAYFTFRAQPTEGTKSITLEVIDSSGSSVTYQLTTDADYLQQAMDEMDGLTYTVSDGMVEVINGESAIYTIDHAYWSFEVNGEYCNYGIAEQPVQDGDAFCIQYTPAA